jgi:hypothetical protein
MEVAPPHMGIATVGAFPIAGAKMTVAIGRRHERLAARTTAQPDILRIDDGDAKLRHVSMRGSIGLNFLHRLLPFAADDGPSHGLTNR